MRPVGLFLLVWSGCTVESEFPERCTQTGDAARCSVETDEVGVDGIDTVVPESDACDLRIDAPSVTFALLGDAGTGDDNQRDVGRRLAEQCAACDFVLYLGDNVYESGVGGSQATRDALMKERFKKPYRRSKLSMPFFVVAGNHDYGWGGAAMWALFDQSKIDPQLGWHATDDRWTFPTRYYTVQPNNQVARFIAVDTPTIVLGGDKAQHAWAVAEAETPFDGWTFVFGHHTLLSNAKHGNAGQYPEGPTEPSDGARWLDLIDDMRAKGPIHGVFTGHDHSLQWFKPDNYPHVIVSGAGGKSNPLRRANERDNDTAVWQPPGRDEVLGFVVVRVDADSLTASIHTDDMLEPVFTASFCKEE